jgi:hypothetical protein
MEKERQISIYEVIVTKIENIDDFSDLKTFYFDWTFKREDFT